MAVPAHTGSTASHPAGTPAVLDCAWSCFQQVQELVLHGICLDSPLMVATLECQQLTALHVGGLELQQDVRTVTGLVPSAGMTLSSLRALQVDQHFDLGPNMAAALFPELSSLKVTHAGSSRYGRLPPGAFCTHVATMQDSQTNYQGSLPRRWACRMFPSNMHIHGFVQHPLLSSTCRLQFHPAART
jgi:hypothetical protein